MGFREGFSNSLAALQYVQDQGEQGTARRKQNTLASLAGDYAAGGQPDYQGIAANGGDPLAFRKDAQGQQDRQTKELGQYAGYLASLPAEARPQAYAAMKAKLAPIGQQLGLPPLPEAWDESHLPELQALAQMGGGAGAGGSVQSSFVDASGQRMAIMRDGSVRPLGQNAPNNQIIDTGNGFFGVNKGSLSAAPVMLGQGPQSPPAPVQAPPPGNNDALIATANQMVAAGIPQQFIEQWMSKQPGIGPAGDAPQGATEQAPAQANFGSGQQLRSAPKPATPSELDRRIQAARQMGASPAELKRMVVGGPAEAAATQSLGDTSKTGAEYLTTLQPTQAAQVRALAEGRMAFPSGTALKSPHWQAMLEAVSQFDPNFDAVNYNARNKTRQAFTSGKEAQTVNALNTVAEHLGTFSDNATALGNYSHLGPLTQVVNKAKNAFAEASGDPKISAFNTNKKAVADEVAKVWRASGGSEADIQENLKNLDGAQSPEQLNAAIGTLTQLIYGKVSALQDQYGSGMGTTQTPRPLVSADAQKAFDKTLARMNGGKVADKPQARYKVGQVVIHGGKKFRVTGGDLSDPDVEEIK